MRVSLLAFASAAEALGGAEHDLELPAGASVAELRGELERRHPAVAPLWPRLAVAVDGELADAETALRDGAEVALLPPVSGGRPPARLTEEPLEVGPLLREVGDPSCGAVVLFVGTARARNAGREVVRLAYSAYRPMAEAALERILTELAGEEEGLRLGVVHRLGDVAPGEPSVLIAAASPHRDAAYRASRAALERLKREVPIWKREHYADGEAVWREEEPLAAG